jgi:putative membrane protein
MRVTRALQSTLTTFTLIAVAATPAGWAQVPGEDKEPVPQEKQVNPQEKQANPPSSGTKPAVKAKSDAEIIALVIAMDDNEIQTANLALKQKLDPKVLELARMIVQEHSKNRAQTQELARSIGIEPKSTASVSKLRAKGKKTQASLYSKQGQELDAAFVTEMVNGHREALAMLDDFIGTAQSAELKTHLTQARQHVAMHLQHAEQLETSVATTR